ncbi:hypothetical protein [Salipiger thiooxidans]|uniref:hypothetical protein n=1 Tax=Salipiger thiooxidans TaxID=282683 RepID=UPI001CD4E5FA|nr:hypothetical protein [Salipiger thiooxidans]MCA0847183.1 hypothetical protein [Salipiger thiooxidans]
MFTTGQLTKKIGIETNTMIRWLREGIILPEPGEGRNKSFSFEEVIVGRAVAPLYTEWSLRAELLVEIADFVRGMLSIRKELGYADWQSFMADIQTWRAKGAMRLALDANLEGEALEAALRTMEARASKRGVDLSVGWNDPGTVGPKFSDEAVDRVRGYERIFENLFGEDRSFLFVARNADGAWHWAFSSFEQFQERFQSDATSFIVVDLAKALSD